MPTGKTITFLEAHGIEMPTLREMQDIETQDGGRKWPDYWTMKQRHERLEWEMLVGIPPPNTQPMAAKAGMTEITKWATIRPDGTIVTDSLCSSMAAAIRGVSDDNRQWKKLVAEGWKVSKVRITTVDDDG